MQFPLLLDTKTSLLMHGLLGLNFHYYLLGELADKLVPVVAQVLQHVHELALLLQERVQVPGVLRQQLRDQLQALLGDLGVVVLQPLQQVVHELLVGLGQELLAQLGQSLVY